MKALTYRPSTLPALGKRKRTSLPFSVHARHTQLGRPQASATKPSPPEKLLKYYKGAPVNKFRQGFFAKPQILQKQAADPGQKQPKSNDKSDNNGSSESEAVFRNVVHELQDLNLPVEMHYARTDDGYWIPVVRVPAKDARHKLVMHLGMFDDLWSAASLVPAAREDGMDVFLVGNRNCPPFVRDPDAKGGYFDYSIDELGLQDIKAADEVINALALKELGGTDDDPQPAFDHIKLVHSMAGAAVFIYLTDCLKRGEKHGVKQVIAAGPAGFQRPKGLLGLGSGVLKLLLRIPAEWQTGAAFPVGLTEETLISDPIFRALYDLTSIKPFDQAAAFALRTLLAGDTSKWSDAIRREHYNPAGMPVVTWKIVLHLLQQINSHRFTRFDYGSEKNNALYGSHKPLDVSTLYDLIDFRIDFVAGAKDSIVSPKAVQKHVNAVVQANEHRAGRGEAPISWTYEVLPHLGHLDIIDGEDTVTVACLRRCWQRMYV